MPRPSGLSYILITAVVAIGLPCHGAGPKGIVEGRVLDAQGNPVSGATVQIGRPGSAWTRNGTLYCGGAGIGPPAGGGVRSPEWIENIPLGGNDPCGDAPNAGRGTVVEAAGRYARLSEAQQLQLQAWGNRTVQDLHTAKTDSQGHYQVQAFAMSYAMVAFRPGFISLPSGRSVFSAGPFARDAVDIGAGQTVTRDLILAGPRPAIPAAAVSSSPAPPLQPVDWPILYDGPLKAGGSVCVNFFKPTSDSSFRLQVAFDPPREQSQVLWVLDGGRFSFGPFYSGPVSGLDWGMTSGVFNAARKHTLTLILPQPATELKFQALVSSPSAGDEPGAATRCK